MKSTFDRRSRSLWMDIDVVPAARQLEGDIHCDTVIIGSGIAGISTAYELALEGQKVAVVDRGAIAGGADLRRLKQSVLLGVEGADAVAGAQAADRPVVGSRC